MGSLPTFKMNLEEDKGKKKNKSITLQSEVQNTKEYSYDDEDEDLAKFIAFLTRKFGRAIKRLNQKLKGTTSLNFNMPLNSNYNTSRMSKNQHYKK